MSDRPRGPGVVFGGLTLVLLILIGVFALTQRQPPPPSIAEFAPQSQDTITDAPNDQSSSSGRGGGAGAGGVEIEKPSALPSIAPVSVPRVRKCIGDPPRQIEDPQSPPCVPYWSGDNGGATHRGVTRDEIRLGTLSSVDPLIAFFNKRFEFYGRKLIGVPIEATGDSDAAMQADAIQADEEGKVFGVFAWQANGDERRFVYYDELARRGIVSVESHPTSLREDHFTEHHPYEWTFVPTFDVIARNQAAWICSALKGRPAQWAKGGEQGKTRVFGLTYDTTYGYAPPVDDIVRPLEACGITLAAKAGLEESDDRTSNSTAASENAMLQMRVAGVTSVISAGNAPPTFAATNQGFFPEWIISTFDGQDHDFSGHLVMPSGQSEQMFGQRWWNKQNAASDMPYVWAMKEMGQNPNSAQMTTTLDWTYYSLLVMASGIQMAGPKLTPHTFADGLQKTRFPNPGAGTAPLYQARIGFEQDHSAQDDAILVWWDDSQPSNLGLGAGTFCNAQLGTRYGIGRRPWPADNAGLFELPCY